MKTLERTTFTPTGDPSVWYAGSRSRPGVTYRIERVGYPDMWCACPATKRCAHLNELDELLAAARPALADEWNDIAPVRALQKEAPLNASESPTALTVVGRDIATRPEQALAAQFHDPGRRETLRRTIAADLNDSEFDLFEQICISTGLNPFMRQIHPVVRGTGQNRKVTFQTAIDGYRLIAVRTGQYDGQDEPEWCGKDGVWRDVWTDDDPPFAARIRVYKAGIPRAFTAIAKYSEYVQTAKDFNTGKQGPNSMWQKMPTNQLSKCAESLALRKAFPAETSGIYTHEEMGQADNRPEVYIDGGVAPEQAPPAARTAKPTYPWSSEFREALADSPFEIDDVCQFLDTDRANSGPAIDTWLNQGSPRDLMIAIGRWVDAGRKHSAAAPEPATEPEMFDEAEWSDPSADPAMEAAR